MTYDEWEAGVPKFFCSDPLWTVAAYRKSLFMTEICWSDVTKLVADRRTISLADQLYRAAGSVGANIAEGYSRGTGKDRARFYEYALGSARETRDWYYKARHVLGDAVMRHRCELPAEISRLLLTMIPDPGRKAPRSPLLVTHYAVRINAARAKPRWSR